MNTDYPVCSYQSFFVDFLTTLKTWVEESMGTKM